MRRSARAFLLGIGLTGLSLIASAQQVFTVNCTAGETINGALVRGDARKPMTIQVSGTCTENVVITRDDVALVGMPGGVSAANSGEAAIQVGGSRVTINGLEVTGGVNAIAVNGHYVVIQKTTLQGATEYGLYVSNGSGAVSDSLITNNGLAGVMLRAANARLIGNQIIGNALGIGINVTRNSSFSSVDNEISGNLEGVVLAIGSTASLDGDAIGPNASHGLELATGSTVNLLDVTISGSGEEGILLDSGSTATIAGGTIGPNGDHGIGLFSDSRAHLTNVTIAHNGDASSEHGIYASFSQVSIEGGCIEHSSGRGMVLHASRAELSDVLVDSNPREGIFGRIGSTLAIAGGTISNNGSSSGGAGVWMQHNGTLNIEGPITITGNSGAGILLSRASKMLATGTVNAAGNSVGLDCQDGESSWQGGSISGGVSLNCTGY